jgi:signal transduction histidine kinase
MTKENKPANRKKPPYDSLFLDRLKNLYSSQEELPASISIREAEELKARVKELETKLAGQTDASQGKLPAAGITPSNTPASLEKNRPSPWARPGLESGKMETTKSKPRFQQPRLQTRLTALILLITIPVLIGITALISSWAGSRIEANANQDLQASNEALAANISSWLDLNISSLEEMVLLPAITSMQADQQRPVLQAMAQTHPYMYLVSTTDLTGANIARNDDAKLADYSDRYWFQNARAGAPVTFQSLIGRTSGKPALVVSAPIQDTAGNIIGVGMFAADLTNLSEQVRVRKVGETGYIYIVDSQNNVLAHPDPAYTTDELYDMSEYPPVAALRQGQKGLTTFTDENGVRWRAYVSVLENGWGVITQQPEAEILAPVRQFQRIAIALILAGAAVMLVLSWSTIRRTLLPISVLTDTASAIAAGDINRVVNVEGGDEIAVLASSFNEMTSQLRGMITSLEERVQDRTHDLELAAEVGQIITEKVADLHEMLTSAVELIRARFNLYYTQVYLSDAHQKTLTLKAGTGEVGAQLLQKNHRLSINSASINGRAVIEQKPVIVADTAKSPNFLPNPLLPNTRSEMAIPLIAGGQVIGVLDMQSEIPGALNEYSLPAFEALAGQLSVAIQNANLFAQTQEAQQEVEANVRRSTQTGWQDFLNGIGRSEKIGYLYNQDKVVTLQHAEGTPPQQNLSVPISIMGTEVGKIQVADDARAWTPQDVELISAAAARLSRHIESLRLLSQAEQYRAQAEQAVRQLTRQGWESYLATREEVSAGFVYDRAQVSPLDGNKEVNRDDSIKHPLRVRDETIGELAVDLTNADSGEAAALITAVAEQLSNHIENLRLSEQNRKRAHEMETVAELSATTSTLLDPDRLLQTIVDLTKERFGVYHAHIYLTNDAWQTLILAAGAGEVGRRMVAEEHTIPLDAEQSLVARASRDRRAVIVEDVHQDPGFLPNPFLPETRSEMAVPMIVGEKVLGVFDVQSDKANGFSDEDASIFTTLAAQVAVALQNARLYAEQAATVTQLRELDRLKSSFLANMSHELRTPLNSILGFADVMIEGLDGPLTENMDNDLRLIQKNGQHLLDLINDVLDMAKIEAGKMSLSTETFTLHDVLEEITSITSPLASERSLSLFIEADSDSEVKVAADRTRLRQVMLNLVNNAIKFTEKGKIAIRAIRQDESVLIRVKDTGIGIPPEQLETIFQEFAQVDTSTTRKAGGTGLGLPISRRLIEMHGGRLWAESTGIAGEGSTFYVLLPVEAKNEEA